MRVLQLHEMVESRPGVAGMQWEGRTKRASEILERHPLAVGADKTAALTAYKDARGMVVAGTLRLELVRCWVTRLR